MASGMIFNIQRYSLHDGPGIRTTVFFKGCPLRCRWCHNPESQAGGPELLVNPDRCIGCGECQRHCPHGAVVNAGGILVTRREKCRLCGACTRVCAAGARVMTGREVTLVQALAEIEKDLVFFDQSGGGVTFSGGEPLAQPDFLQDLLAACRQRGIHTAVDTCGFASPDTLPGIARVTDLFLYDLKLMDEARHREHTGVSNQVILHNLKILAQSRARVIVRLPLVPGVNDDEGNTRQTARFLSSLPNIRQVSLLPYHNTGTDKYNRLGKVYGFAETGPPPEPVLQRTREILQASGLTVSIGG